jgi:hypothetical protein
MFMKFKSRKTYTALSVVLLALMLTVMACTAQDTLFIHLTLTPTPTITPTPISTEGVKYKIGDKLTIIGNSPFSPVGLNANAGPFSPVTSATQCLPKTSVTVGDISRNIADANDNVIYYLVGCNGKKGWIPEYQITAYPVGTKLVIKSADGAGASVFQQNDAVKGKPLDEKCPDGTAITVADAQTGKVITDRNVYLQITCDKLKGYVLDTDVAPAG